MEYSYYPMHMHLHASCDYGSSMSLYMYNAKKLGMKYIWLTDHDTRMGMRKHTVNEYKFDSENLIKTSDEFFCGFEAIENTVYSIDTEKQELTLNVESDNEKWKSSGIYFVSKGTHHTYALAGGVILGVDIKDYKPEEDARLIFAVKLSQRPPELENAYMLYVIGDTEGLDGDNNYIIPMEYKKGKLTLPVSADALNADKIGGQDNAFDTLYIIVQSRNGKSKSVTISDFTIQREKTAEALRRGLQNAADKVGEGYGVTAFVSYEISGAGEHKNCFCTDVPVIEYDKPITEEEAIAHVKKYNGIFAYNHPFAIKKFKGKGDSPEELKIEMFKELYSELFSKNALGATLMEVGFPEGRNFGFNYYLYLWDMLALSGVFLTGYGANDCHRNNIGWFEGNNFAAYIGVDSKLPHPISEKAFTDAMKKRRAYTADPVKFKGKIDFKTSDGRPMGTIVSIDEAKEINLEFSAENLEPGWEFKLVENGVYIHSEKITESRFSFSSKLCAENRPITFQRAELWDENGRCILLTNPIYLVDVEFVNGERV